MPGSEMALLVIIYAVSIVIVNPHGDFPLNDDWPYAGAVNGLVEHGDWRTTGWTGASLITQSVLFRQGEDRVSNRGRFRHIRSPAQLDPHAA